MCANEKLEIIWFATTVKANNYKLTFFFKKKNNINARDCLKEANLVIINFIRVDDFRIVTFFCNFDAIAR